MPKTKGQKQAILAELSDKASKAKSIVFTQFSGLEAKENEELRKELRAENSEYYVAKKTLLDIALKNANINNVDVRNLPGQIAAVFGYGDEVTPAKIVDKFVDRYKKEKTNKIVFVGGVLENKFLTAANVSELAKLPSKQELYAKLVGTINAPVSGFVNVLAGNLRGLVTVLKAIEGKK